MKLTVEIPDNKADFMLELLNSLPYVKVLQDRRAQKAAAKAASIDEMKEAIDELKEVLAGRKESKDLYEFLKEVDQEDGV